MAKMIVRELDSQAESRRARATKLKVRRARAEDGSSEKVYVLDALSPNFGDQFLKLFQLNVAEARRETREIQKKRRIAAE